MGRSVGARIGFYPAEDSTRAARPGEGIILECVPDRRVVYGIDFTVVVTHRVIEFSPMGEGTRVTWHETLRATNPWARYALLLHSPEIEAEFGAVLHRAGEL